MSIQHASLSRRLRRRYYTLRFNRRRELLTAYVVLALVVACLVVALILARGGGR